MVQSTFQAGLSSTSATGLAMEYLFPHLHRQIAPGVQNIQLYGVAAPDGTVNLLNPAALVIYTGMKIQNQRITGTYRLNGTNRSYPADFGDCSRFSPDVVRLLFGPVG